MSTGLTLNEEEIPVEVNPEIENKSTTSQSTMTTSTKTTSAVSLESPEVAETQAGVADTSLNVNETNHNTEVGTKIEGSDEDTEMIVVTPKEGINPMIVIDTTEIDVHHQDILIVPENPMIPEDRQKIDTCTETTLQPDIHHTSNELWKVRTGLAFIVIGQTRFL